MRKEKETPIPRKGKRKQLRKREGVVVKDPGRDGKSGNWDQ